MVTYCHLTLPDGQYAVRYAITRRGEGLPMHSHAPALEHSVEVLRGRAEIYGTDRNYSFALPLGEEFIFDSALPHEIVALEDDTVLLNRYRCGMPPEYASLPPEELAGLAELPPMTHTLEGT